MSGGEQIAEGVVEVITDTTMGLSVVRPPGPCIAVSDWEGVCFAGLEACWFFFWVFLVLLCLGVGFWKMVGAGFENVVLGLAWFLCLSFF
jgi:hypothetical protein